MGRAMKGHRDKMFVATKFCRPTGHLPNDTPVPEIIASLNVRQLLASELAASHKEFVDQYKTMVSLAIQGNEEAKSYLDALSFDLFRDIHHVTVASGAEPAASIR